MGYLTYIGCFVALFLVTDAQDLAARILGGGSALPSEYPFVASVHLNGRHYCGGTIVHQKWILTAAHCIFNQTEETLRVVVGTSVISAGGDSYKVKKIVIHEMYQYVTDVIAVQDIGLLLLENPIRLTPKVKIGKLTTRMFQPGLNTILIGWGRISQMSTTPSDQLNIIELSTITNQQCATLLTNRTLNIGNFCTGALRNKGGCYGDSGSPLIEQLTEEIIGLYSWVVPPCGSGLPDGYTDIWEYLDWINSHIQPYN